jgi:hypothetical protein
MANESFTLVAFVSETIGESDIHDSHMTVLVLVTLGNVTQIGSFYLCRSAQGGQGKYKFVTITCRYCRPCHTTFANVNVA